MIKLLLVIIGLLFSACVSPKVLVHSSEKIEHKNKKLFPQEDSLIMFALRAEQIKDFSSAANIFDTLYLKSQRKEYLHRCLQNLLYLKHNAKVLSKIASLDVSVTNDPILRRLKIVALIQENRLDEALGLGLILVEKSQIEDDYILVSDIYSMQEKYDEAIKYLQSAYSKEYSEKILDKMSIILYVNLARKKDAIAQLETHSMVHGCSTLICKRLISFYSNDNNMQGLLSAYKRYYAFNPTKEISKKIIQLYGYKKEYVKLLLFLEESKSDDVTLLQLYVGAKNYKKASILANELYIETGNSKYFGESIIYEYESEKDKNDKVFLNNLFNKFETLLEMDSQALYFNYYGYLLIDHNRDVRKGMEYIKKALLVEEDSAYFLDSLAWGYYRLGECKTSLELIQKVRSLQGGDDPEVIKHHEKIKKCKGKN